jgi:hypothetical protein
MNAADVGPVLRKVAALRALCLRLPHIPTPNESGLLARFDVLAGSPDHATHDDVEAIAAGWRRWWSEGRVEALVTMAARLPAGLLERDRRLTSWAQASSLAPRPVPSGAPPVIDERPGSAGT